MPNVSEDILAIILGGGRGTRLHPLTKMRSKPAVPIAGKYRLIDIPLSNCINSGIYRIAVLTQFHSVSLNRHITRTYRFDNFHTGWVQILAAEQTLHSEDWYQGTADAVRKQLREIIASDLSYSIILAGDHLYRMDYAEMAKFHWENNADITVGVHPVPRHEVRGLGILKVDGERRITNFVEKPKDPDVQNQFISMPGTDKPFLASMGIYMFNTNVLIDLLTENPEFDDFGKHVIPSAINTHRVYGYAFDDYWQDIGTIRSFYETNLALCRSNAPFNLYEVGRPIYTFTHELPGSVIENSELKDVQLSEGCQIFNATIINSTIGVRSRINSGTLVKDTIMMGADFYSRPHISADEVPIGIGKNCHIEGAILDKNVQIGDNVVIKPFPRGIDMETEQFVIQDGIVVIPKDTLLQDGTVIAP